MEKMNDKRTDFIYVQNKPQTILFIHPYSNWSLFTLRNNCIKVGGFFSIITGIKMF